MFTADLDRLKSQRIHRGPAAAALLIVALGAVAPVAAAPMLDPFYAREYVFQDLGPVAGVPANNGGVTFKIDDPNVLLIGGQAAQFAAKIYAVQLNRGCGSHVLGFEGAATFFADAYGASGGLDGGLTYGPGGVLFYTTYNDNRLGQILPGSTAPDMLINLNLTTVDSSTGACQFVPAGFGGAGKLKFVSYNSSRWYSANLVPGTGGTYGLDFEDVEITISGGPEGIVFVPAGSPLFPVPSALVCEWGTGTVAAYELNRNSDPIPSTRRIFMSGLSGAEGAAIDPFSGDFIFSTFEGGNHVIVVRGFNLPDPLLADFNDDGHVNGIDLAILLGNWSIPASAAGCGGVIPCPADLDGNCAVNGFDLALLLGSWTG